MKKHSIVRLSLLAVSAITAAFIPSKASSSAAFAGSGVLSLSSDQNENPPDVTCRAPIVGENQYDFNCSYTATINNGAGSSTDNILNSNSNSFNTPLYTISATTDDLR